MWKRLPPLMRRPDWPALALILAVAVYFVAVVGRTGRSDGILSFDVYNYYYPNMLYAVHSVRAGGAGLWWNALLNCGQPFFANNFAGVLYPPNILWLLLRPDEALRAVIGVNLLVAGVSAYALGRTLGVGRVAAVSGALAFQLGNAMVRFSTWGPQTAGPYVWLPAILLGCERVLQRPTFGRAVFLGTIIAIALLPGFPQVVFFAYQMMALRVLWEFATRRVAQPAHTLLYLALGVTVPLLLVAVQLLPALELAGVSVRQGALTQQELAPSGFMDWTSYRHAASFRSTYTNPLMLVPCMLAGLALLHRATRRAAIFYLATGALYFGLAFGANTPLFRGYVALPLGALFRDPVRFMWVVSFCLAVLAALGVEAIGTPTGGAVIRARVSRAAVLVPIAIGFFCLVPNGFLPYEWSVAAAVVILASVVARTEKAARWAEIGVLAALATNLLVVHRTTSVRLLDDGGRLYANRPVFEALQQRMTPQDRVHIIPAPHDPALEPKTASLFDIPAVHDYEPAPSRRFAEYYLMMRLGTHMRSLNQLYFPLEGHTPPGFKRRLLDLAAARYVVAARRGDRTATAIDPPLRLLSQHPSLRVYENSQALPRAMYVPRVEVVASDRDLLLRLAAGNDDARQLALIEEPPPAGFMGVSGTTDAGSTEFVRNDPEDVAIRVRAPARGFLFLADQYFPGWEARVNGTEVPIMRANYLFRLVEVPAGESLVEFRYAPRSIRLGATISVLAIASLAAVGLLRRRRRAPSPAT